MDRLQRKMRIKYAPISETRLEGPARGDALPAAANSPVPARPSGEPSGTPTTSVPRQRWSAVADWVFLLVLLLLGTGLRVIGAHTGNGTAGTLEWVFWYLSIAWAVALTHRSIQRVAMTAWRRVGDWVDRCSPWLLLLCASSCTGFLASAPGRARTILSDNHASDALGTVLLATFIGTVAGLIQMTPSHRLRAFERLRRIGWFGPIILTGSFLACVVSLFTYITLYSKVRFAGIADVGTLSASRVASFYLWHFFKLLPFGDLPATLGWREPLTYHGTDVGRRVVAFQLATVTAVVSMVRAYWKFRQDELLKHSAEKQPKRSHEKV
jgi:hypothetical protein